MAKRAARKKVPVKKKPINSRRKGANGERELAQVLRDFGYEARRGQQFSGGSDSPDVVSDLPGVHLEVKRVEAGNLHKWLAQATRDAKAGGKFPVVAHKRNGSDWVAILPFDKFLHILSFGV